MGNDRFATREELKTVLTGTKVGDLNLFDPKLLEEPNCGGPLLGYWGRRVWTHTGEGHTLFVGSTGTGKTRCGVVPLAVMLMLAGESATIVDPKTELYRKLYWLAKKLGYRVNLVDFANIYRSARFNVLKEAVDLYVTGEPEKRQTALDMVDELAQSLFPPSHTDPFWADSARSVFKAAVITLLEHAEPEQVNLASVYQFLTVGDEQYLNKTYLQAFIENLPPESAVARQMRSYCTTANDTKAGIRSTFLEGLSLFSRSDAMIEFFSGDDLDISRLDGKEKTLTFLCIPDRTSVYDRVCGVLVSQLMSHYVRIADEVYHGALPIRHNFIVDEYGNISSALCNMPHLLSAGRSRGIRVHYVLQSLSQLTAAHSPSDAKTILNNTDVVVAFRTNDWETMESLSKLMGERTIDYGRYQVKEPLMSPAQFQELDTGQAFVSLRGKYRFVAFLPDYEELFDFSDWEPPTYPTRTPEKKTHLFNIKEHVLSIKRKRLKESLAQGGQERKPGPGAMAELLSRAEQFRRELESHQREELWCDSEDEDEENEENEGKPTLVLISVAKHRRQAVAQELAVVCRVPLATAEGMLEHLPATIPFPTKEEALAAQRAISHAGGVIIAQ